MNPDLLFIELGEGDVFSHVASVRGFSSFVQFIVGSAELPFQAADPAICICEDVQVTSEAI